MDASLDQLPRTHKDVPADIYVPLVASLYDEGRALFVGSIMATGAILLTYWKSGEPLLLACALAVTVVACARGAAMRAFLARRATVRTTQDARRWERLYVLGAATSVALLGVWCFIGFAWTDDPLVDLVSFSITIAYVVGISGRNFGSGRLVIVQILCAWVPMTGALVFYGDTFHRVFAVLLVPFFVGLKFISDRLRRTLLDAVTATRDMSFLAMRFNTALNNMPLGLCMFNADGRIAVANNRLNQVFGLPVHVILKGMDVPALIEAWLEAGAFDRRDAERLRESIANRLDGHIRDGLVLETLQQRTIEVTFQPMENGGMVFLFQDITERKLAEARINHLARYDALTGLPNRTMLRDWLHRVVNEDQQGRPYAIHFIDLDQFKQVNDTLGHTRGDMLLQAVADRLRSIVRETEMVSRFGGDEFVVLQHPVRGQDQASALARRIVKALGRPYSIDSHEVVIGATVGIALSSRRDFDLDHLLKNADMALYRAKAEGRGTWRFFKPEMEIDAQARRLLELDLRNALETNQFELHFQPIVDLATNRITTCEALLRWNHPERGLVPPATFIPVAEEMGLIVEIGKRVLRMACLECLRWPSDVRVAVNLSPIEFARGHAPIIVRETLAATGLPAKRLEIELTESTLLQDTRSTRAALQQLEALGVTVSLDDFGTGYSSLSYLHSFPLHKVKIDRSFLQGLGASERKLTLLRGVARLSTELGLRVVAEGIETREQLELIQLDAIVDEAQGFLFGKPMPGREIRKRLYAMGPAVERVA